LRVAGVEESDEVVLAHWAVDFLDAIEEQDENDYQTPSKSNFFDAVSAKFGVEWFSGVLANDVKPFGVEVIIVEPGAFRTDWTCLRSRTGIFAPAGTVSLCAERRALRIVGGGRDARVAVVATSGC